MMTKIKLDLYKLVPLSQVYNDYITIVGFVWVDAFTKLFS